jgi:hypothetical protein
MNKQIRVIICYEPEINAYGVRIATNESKLNADGTWTACAAYETVDRIGVLSRADVQEIVDRLGHAGVIYEGGKNKELELVKEHLSDLRWICVEKDKSEKGVKYANRVC